MQHGVSFQGALEGEVELLDGFACREPGGFDPQLTAVSLTGGDFTPQAGSKDLFVGPFFAAGPFRQPLEGTGQRWGFLAPNCCQVTYVISPLVRSLSPEPVYILNVAPARIEYPLGIVIRWFRFVEPGTTSPSDGGYYVTRTRWAPLRVCPTALPGRQSSES